MSSVQFDNRCILDCPRRDSCSGYLMFKLVGPFVVVVLVTVMSGGYHFADNGIGRFAHDTAIENALFHYQKSWSD